MTSTNHKSFTNPTIVSKSDQFYDIVEILQVYKYEQISILLTWLINLEPLQVADPFCDRGLHLSKVILQLVVLFPQVLLQL